MLLCITVSHLEWLLCARKVRYKYNKYKTYMIEQVLLQGENVHMLIIQEHLLLSSFKLTVTIYKND